MQSLALILRKKEKMTALLERLKQKQKELKLNTNDKPKFKRKRTNVFSKIEEVKGRKYIILKFLMIFIHLE